MLIQRYVRFQTGKTKHGLTFSESNPKFQTLKGGFAMFARSLVSALTTDQSKDLLGRAIGVIISNPRLGVAME